MLAICFLLVPSAQSATLTVCGSGCNSTTIQGAIDLAVSDDTVDVVAGIYNESLIINKSLNLEGAKAGIDSRGGAWGSVGLTTINAGDGNNGILISASEVTVNGFKIIESGRDAEIFSLDFPFESAIYIYNESAELVNISIIYNWIDDNHGSGIVIRFVNAPVVEYNYISNNGDGVWAAAGIGGQELTGGSFSHNEFFNDISYGIYFGGGKVGSLPVNTSGVLISDNDFHHNEKYGLQLYGYYEPWSVSNSGLIVEGNVFHDNGRCGIKLTDFSGTLLDDNVFRGNGANGTSEKYEFGALVSAYYTAAGTVFLNNTFYDNELGGLYFLLELADADLSSIVVNRSNFLDSGLGVKTATRGAFDFPFVVNAENNWWGTVIPNASDFYGNLTYFPFCLSYGCVGTIEDELAGFSGISTTNFSAIANWSDVDLVLESDAGMINWSVPVDLLDSNLRFGESVSITYRRISINAGAMPELNHPAVLTFASTGFTSISQFVILRNGVQCLTDICTSYHLGIDGSVTLAVAQMSEYSLLESPIYQNLVESGSGLGGFLTALTNPLVNIILGLGIVGGILLIFFAIGGVIRGAVSGSAKSISQ